MVLVSVIMPTHNRAKFIERSVRSVLTQTYENFELIVVDDCSLDTTSMIIAALAEEDSRIHYLQHDTNLGAQAARNTGVKASKGEWISFLDSDDEWYPNKLEKQVKTIKDLSGSVGVIHGDCDIQHESTGEKKRMMVPKLSGYVYKELLKKPGPLYQCLMVKRACFEQIPEAIDPNVPSWQEWDTSINLAKKYDFHFIDEPLMVYYRHSGETISYDFQRDREGYVYIVEKHKGAILEHCGREALGNHYRIIAVKYLKMNDNAHARQFIKKARKYGVKGMEEKVLNRYGSMWRELAIGFRNFYRKAKQFLLPNISK